MLAAEVFRFFFVCVCVLNDVKRTEECFGSVLSDSMRQSYGAKVSGKGEEGLQTPNVVCMHIHRIPAGPARDVRSQNLS